MWWFPRKGKGKEEYLYSAFIQRLVSRRSDRDHTVLPANYTMPAYPSEAFTRWRFHWMWCRTSNCRSLLIYRPREDERLSWPGWLTYSGRLTNISGHPSATGWAQDGERTLDRDWRSTAEPRGPTNCYIRTLTFTFLATTASRPVNNWVPASFDDRILMSMSKSVVEMLFIVADAGSWRCLATWSSTSQ